MTAPSITRISPTEYDALTTAIRSGGMVMRTRDHKITTLIALQRRDWADLVRVGGRVVAAQITSAGRHAVARFSPQMGRGVDPRPFDERPVIPAQRAAVPSRIAQADPFALLDIRPDDIPF